MITILCRILPLLLMCAPTYFIHPPMDTEESVTLSEVKVINEPHIHKILKKIVSETRSNSSGKVNFLTVRLMNDSCGILMKTVAQTKSSLSWYDGYSGYTVIEDIPVIFINKSSVVFKEIPEKQGVFPMDAPYEPPFVYDPDVWRFILKEDSYARYYDGRGWIWFQDNETKDYNCQ